MPRDLQDAAPAIGGGRVLGTIAAPGSPPVVAEADHDVEMAPPPDPQRAAAQDMLAEQGPPAAPEPRPGPRLVEPTNDEGLDEGRGAAAFAAFRAQALGIDGQRAGRALALAKRTGLDPTFVAQNLDTVQAQAERDDEAAILAAHPGLLTAFDDPTTGAMLRQNLPAASALEQLQRNRSALCVGMQGWLTDYLLPGIVRSLQKGADVERPMLEAAKALNGTLNTEDAARLTELQKQDQPEDVGMVEGAIYGAAEMLPMLGAVTAAGGLTALLGAPAAAVAGVGAGVMGAITFVQSLGSTHERILKASENEAGIPQVDPDTAFHLALGAASIETGIVSVLGPEAVKGAPLVGRLFSKVGPAAVEHAMADRTLSRILVDGGKAYGSHWLAGVAAMGSMAGISESAAQIGAHTAGKQIDEWAAWNSMLDAGKHAMGVMAILGVWHPASETAREVGRLSRVPEDSARFDALSAAVKDSKIPDEHLERIVSELRQGGLDVPDKADDARTIYVTRPAFDAIAEAEHVPPAQLFDAIVGSKDAYSLALRGGTDLAIPIEKYAAKMIRSGFHDKLRADVKFSHDGFTQREAEKTQKDLAAYQQGTGPAAQELTAIHERMLHKALDAGYPVGPSRAFAKLVQTIVVRNMARFETGPEATLKILREPTIHGPGAAVEPLANIPTPLPPPGEARGPATETWQEHLARPENAPPPSPFDKPGERVDQAISLPGRETKIETPQRPREPARYEVVEASSLVPSHNPQTFDKNAAHPGNERDYQNTIGEQTAVAVGAGKLNNDLLLSDTPSPVDGPPLVAEDGSVAGGNKRTMMIQRAFADNPAARDAYKADLLKRAEAMGLDKAAVEKMDSPVLIRRVTGLKGAAEPTEFTGAVRRYNESLTQGLSSRAKGMAEAKVLSPEALGDLAGLLAQGDASLREVVRDRPKDVLAVLRREGLVTPQNEVQWMEGGKLDADRVEAIFLGRLMESEQRFNATAPGLRAKLERIAPALLRVAGLNPGLDETARVRSGVDLINEAKAHGLTIDQLLAQGSMFGHERPPEVVAMAHLLEGNGQRDLQARFASWAQYAAVDPRQATMLQEAPTRAGSTKILKQGEVRAILGSLPAGATMADLRSRLESWPETPTTPKDVADHIGDLVMREVLTPEEARRLYDAWEHEGVYVPIAGDLSGDMLARFNATEAGPTANQRILRQGEARKILRQPSLDLDGSVQRLDQSPGPRWFSPALRAAEGAKQAKGDAKSWEAILSKTPGVKAEELEETGVREWLREQKGSVTREAVAKYLREHQVELTEKELGEEDPRYAKAVAEGAIDRGFARRGEPFMLIDGDYAHSAAEDRAASLFSQYLERPGEPPAEQLGREAGARAALAEMRSNVQRAQDAVDFARERLEADETAAQHKPGDYDEASGLAQRRADLSEREDDLDRFKTEMEIGEKWAANPPRIEMIRAGGETMYQSYTTGLGEPGTYRELLLKTPKAAAFDAPHFGEDHQGILAHARIATTHDAAGKSVLIVEEAQSDLHQAARESGYRFTAADVSVIDDAAEGGKWWKVHAPGLDTSVLKSNYPTVDSVKRWAVERAQSAHAVPDAPWKNSWEDLLVRRMLSYAAEHGQEKIALTPGKVHTDRYGTDALAWEKKAPPTEAERAKMREAVDFFKEHLGISEGLLRQKMEAAGGRESPAGAVMADMADALGVGVGNRTNAALNDSWKKAADLRSWLEDAYQDGLLEGQTPTGARYSVKYQDQVGGRAGGIDIEAEATRRGMLTRTATTVTSEAELTAYLKNHGMEDKAPKMWAEMQKNDTGLRAGRAEGMSAAYDQRIRGAFDKLLRKYGGEPMKKEKMGPGGYDERRAELKQALLASGSTEEAAEHTIGEIAKGRADTDFASLSDDAALAAARFQHAADNDTKNRTEMWTAEVPEKLRAEALERGMPLFQPPTGDVSARGHLAIIEGPQGKRYEIHLGPNADASTLAHETMHWLVDTLGDAAAKPGADAELVRDHAKLLEWAGYKPGEREEALNVAAEEKIASAWEQYLAEGKAPTEALKSIFGRFARWMARIYGSLQGIAGVYEKEHGQPLDLNDEVRGIFDRLLATSDEIEQDRMAREPAPGAGGGLVPPQPPAEGGAGGAAGGGEPPGGPGQPPGAGSTPPPRPRAVPRVPRAWAHQVLSSKPLGSISDAFYLQAERRAARQAIDLAAKGDMEGSRAADVTRAFAAALRDASKEIRDESMKTWGLLKSIAKPESLARIAKSATNEEGSEYIDVAQTLLEAIGAKGPPAADPSGRVGLGELLQRLDRDRASPAFDEQSLRAFMAAPKNIEQVTPIELANVALAVRQIRTEANRAGKIMAGERLLDRKAAIAEMIAQTANRPEKQAKPVTPSFDEGLKNAAMGFGRSVDATILDPEESWRRLGPTMHDVYRQTIEARNRANEMKGEILRHFQEKFGDLFSSGRFARELRKPIDTKLSFKKYPRPESVNVETLVSAFLNLGTQSNEDRLLTPHGWSRSQVLEDIGKNVPREILDAAQEMLSYSDKTIWPLLSDHLMKTAGATPPKLPPKKILIRFPDGTAKEYEGGYYAVKYDETRSKFGLDRSTSDGVETLDRGARATIYAPFTKARAERYTDVLDLSLRNYPNHLARVFHFLAYDDSVRSIGALLRDKEWTEAATRAIGPEQVRGIKDNLNYISRGGAAEANNAAQAIDRIVGGFLRGRAITTALGFNLRLSVATIPSHVALAVTAGEVSAKNAGIALAHAFPGGASRLAPDLLSDLLLPDAKARWEQHLKESSELRYRADHGTDKIREMFSGSPQFAGWKHNIDAMQFAFMDGADQLLSQVLYEGRKLDAMEPGFKDLAGNVIANEAGAIQWANDGVRRLMPKRNRMEFSQLMRNPGVMGAYALFRGFKNVTANLQSREIDQWRNSSNGRPMPVMLVSAVPTAMKMFGFMAAMGATYAFFNGRGKDDRDGTGWKGWATWLMRKSAAEQFSSLPIADNAAEVIIDGLFHKDDLGSALKEAAGGLRNAYQLALIARQIRNIGIMVSSNNETPDRVQAAIESTLTLMGVGTEPVRHTGRGIYDMASGRYVPRGPFDRAGAAIFGAPDKRNTKNPFTLAQDIASGKFANE